MPCGSENGDTAGTVDDEDMAENGVSTGVSATKNIFHNKNTVDTFHVGVGTIIGRADTVNGNAFKSSIWTLNDILKSCEKKIKAHLYNGGIKNEHIHFAI